jgi:type III secretory pathway component EscS
MNPLCVCVCVCVMAPFYSLTLYEFSLHWNDKIVFICIWISILS